MLSCNTTVTPGDFKIIDRDGANNNLRIKESLYILRDRPDLNVQGQSYPLKLFS
jgi:hypothetical protein